MGTRGEANGAGVILGSTHLVEAARLAELHMAAAHSNASTMMDKTQKALNRIRRIRQAVEEGKYEPAVPRYPITEVSGRSGHIAGTVFAEPRELLDDIGDSDGEFEDADGKRWRLVLLPVFEPVE